jgi:hypothetical protein
MHHTVTDADHRRARGKGGPCRQDFPRGGAVIEPGGRPRTIGNRFTLRVPDLQVRGRADALDLPAMQDSAGQREQGKFYAGGPSVYHGNTTGHWLNPRRKIRR